ncbi:unnamed protein product [Merluccius merluccius]
MEKEILTLSGRSEDLEARSRRNNIHVVGKEEILKAREMERTPEGQSEQILIFPDYTQEVNSKKAAFREARSLLWTCTGVRDGLRYPATLVITPEGG